MPDLITFSSLHRQLSKVFETFSEKRLAAGLQTTLSLLALKYINDSGGDIPQIRSGLGISIPEPARWSVIRKMKTRVGAGLNAAFTALENANPQLFSGMFKGMDLTRKLPGCKTDDRTLLKMTHLFDQILISAEKLAYPELPGKVSRALAASVRFTPRTDPGMFITPPAVARLLASIADPQPGERIYDPASGAGETLIRAAEHVTALGGSLKNILLCGQEIDPAAWAVSRMNMFFYGIHGAEVLNGDALVSPAHIDTDGNLDRFACIISHLPFHMRYPRKETAYPDRFFAVAPEPGRKAAIMFIQHIISALKPGGRAAVIMPGEMLFQIKYMQKLRKHMIANGLLDAVIGLPPNLFPDASAPSCILLLRKNEEKTPSRVYYVNAGRRYTKGRALNSVYAEDVESVLRALRYRSVTEGFSRWVASAEIERNACDLGVPRYVIAAPVLDRHDVRAHLNGGVPVHELDVCARWFENYRGTYKLLFKDRNPFYADFAEVVHERRDIRFLIRAAPGVIRKQMEFRRGLVRWWDRHAEILKRLPDTKDPLRFRRRVLESLEQGLDDAFDLFDIQTLRAACAEFLDAADCRMRTIAAKGWRVQMIPDDEVVRQRFPGVLEQMDADARRMKEIEQSLHASMVDDPAGPVSDFPVLRERDVRTLVRGKKDLDAEIDRLKRNLSSLRRDVEAEEKDAPAADAAPHMASLAEKVEKEIAALSGLSGAIETRLKRHESLTAEMKTLKDGLKNAPRRMKTLAAEARRNLAPGEQRRFILDSFQQMLSDHFDGYLENDLTRFIAAMESIWDKYAFSVRDILAERQLVSSVMGQFFEEMGYVPPDLGSGS